MNIKQQVTGIKYRSEWSHEIVNFLLFWSNREKWSTERGGVAF